MYRKFYETRQPQKSPTVQLNAVYHVGADNSYHVDHRPIPSGMTILVIVTRGNGLLQSQEGSYSLGKGEMLLISPDKGDFSYSTVGECWDFWWFEFYADKLFFQKDRIYKIYFEAVLEKHCKSCLHLLQQHMAQASMEFLALLAELSRNTDFMQESGTEEQLFSQAQLLIQENLSTITVSQIISQLGIGEKELRFLFLQKEGCSPKQYILSLKMETACFLLKETNKSISEISDSLGFSSQFHFSRLFKEKKGNSPAVWRKYKELSSADS